MAEREGWAIDITTKNKTHYFIDGVSLCGKAKMKDHMKPHGNHFGSRWCGDCHLCVKKQKSKNP